MDICSYSADEKTEEENKTNGKIDLFIQTSTKEDDPFLLLGHPRFIPY